MNRKHTAAWAMTLVSGMALGWTLAWILDPGPGLRYGFITMCLLAYALAWVFDR